MKVLVPRLTGFCPGVKAAEKRIFSEIKNSPQKKLSVIGMMINNRKYIEYLKENNIQTIESADNIPDDSTLFIRTHGIDRETQSRLLQNHNLIDLTCRNVKRVQKTIKIHSEKGQTIIITGKKSHPEVTGLKSYGSEVFVIETPEELENFLSNLKIDGTAFNPASVSGIFITSQTTGSRTLFESAIEKIRSRWPELTVESFNSICPVTEKKENEALEIQQEVDISFVIGDPLSSNAKKLYRRLSESGRKTFFIQDVHELKELDIDFSGLESALVVSSASTPDFVEKEVVKYLLTQ